MEKKTCFPSLLVTLYLGVKLQAFLLFVYLLFVLGSRGQEESFYSLWAFKKLSNTCIWHVPTVPGFEATDTMYFGHTVVWETDWVLSSNEDEKLNQKLTIPFRGQTYFHPLNIPHNLNCTIANQPALRPQCFCVFPYTPNKRNSKIFSIFWFIPQSTIQKF